MKSHYVSPWLDTLRLNALNVFAASDTIETFQDPEYFGDPEDDPNNA